MINGTREVLAEGARFVLIAQNFVVPPTLDSGA